MFLRLLVAALMFSALGLVSIAQTLPPIEAYGQRAPIRSMTMSPSGLKIAFIAEQQGKEAIFTKAIGQQPEFIVDISDLAGSSIRFIDENIIIISGYENTFLGLVSNRTNYTGAFALDLKKRKIQLLLDGTRDINPWQSGLGRIVGKLDKGGRILMPAYTGRTRESLGQALFRVNPNTGKGAVHNGGTVNTLSWLAMPDGEVLAREDMSSERNVYRIVTEQGGKRRELLKELSEVPPYRVLGVTEDRSALILTDNREDRETPFLKLDFDGNLSPFDLGETGRSIDSFFYNDNNVIYGIRYTGLFADYSFFDPVLQNAINHLKGVLVGNHIEVIDISDDHRHMLLRIFSHTNNNTYIRVDTSTMQVTPISPARPKILSSSIGQVVPLTYKSRDGWDIPSVLTLPPGVQQSPGLNLPTIIMPHGGPRAHDQVDFDWMAQYFASRGYLVLQPNFRGSSGFSRAHRDAGNGEWGGVMQDDVTDGLDMLVAQGLTDPARVCIVGWSYGGYAALAGGAFTPDKYKCVVSVAGVSDLMELWSTFKVERGNSFTLNYWKEMIGDPAKDREKMRDRSPINHAAAFTAPVLLVHGQLDEIVPPDQSRRMERALKSADKKVTLLTIKDDGHSMLESANRMVTLRALADFVDSHIGQSPQ